MLTNNCTGSGADCVPYVTTGEEKNPFTADPSISQVCPDYTGKKVCCNKNIIQSMVSKYSLMDQAIGGVGTGCSICAANLQRFYCNFNCDPNQSDWVTKTNYVNYYGVEYKVLAVAATIYFKDACKIFQSCNSINFVSALGAAASPQGFFNLLSSQGVSQGNMLFNWTYQDEPITPTKAYTTNTIPCTANFTKNHNESTNTYFDAYNYTLYKLPYCPCQSCTASCKEPDFSEYIQARTLTTGFDSVLVVLVFGVILLVILLMS